MFGQVFMRVFLSSFLVLFAFAVARGVELSRLVVDDDAIEPESQHARFTSMLAQARDQLESATEKLSSVEASPGAVGDSRGGNEVVKGLDSDEARQRTVAQMLPSALTALSDGIAKLQHVHAEVSESALSPEVKAQVLWDLQKMMADSHRLRATSLAGPARDALVKALQVSRPPRLRCPSRI